MNSAIARRQRRNANCYKVIYGRQGFKQGQNLKGSNRKHLTENKDDPVYSINFNDKSYVIKQIGHYDEDEWDVIVKLITRVLICPQMIDYYACIKSMSNHKRYIMMKEADMDLKDFLKKFDLPVTRNFLNDLLIFVLQFQLWCIKNLKMVYTDLKCRNMLILMNQKDDPDQGFHIRITDIGLMEDIRDTYKLNEKMLHSDDIVNFMYPRRTCNYQQCALFTIAMLVIELCTINIKAYGDTSSEESNTDSTDSDSQENQDDLKDNPKDHPKDHPKDPNDMKDDPKDDPKDPDDMKDPNDMKDDPNDMKDDPKDPKDIKDDPNDEDDPKDEDDIKDDPKDEDDIKDDRISSIESDGSTDSDGPMGFINLLDGRKSDDRLILLLEKIPFFKEKEHEDLREFLNELIGLKYETVQEVADILDKIIIKYTSSK